MVFSTLCVPPGSIVSASSVIRCRSPAFSFFLRCPFSTPPTKPPMSFRASCSGLEKDLYSSKLSCVLTGCDSFCIKPDQYSSCPVHTMDFLLVPVVILMVLSLCISPPPNLFCSNTTQSRLHQAAAPPPIPAEDTYS